MACEPEYAPPEPVTSFAILRAVSSATSYEADATFLSPYEWGDCTTSNVGGGCAVTTCGSLPPESEQVTAGPLTIQGKETVVLNEDNSFRASAERPLFAAGEEVLFDLVADHGVPGVRRRLTAPSGSSLSLPPAVDEPRTLELKRGYGLRLEWAPGSEGFMRASLRSELAAVACQWELEAGEAIIDPSVVALLPPSDGKASVVEIWTEQSDVVRKGGWEFLFLLQGRVAGAGYRSFSLD